MSEHYIYILRCKDESLYTGYTKDLKHRLTLHQTGKGAKYTRGRTPLSLVYSKKIPTKREALQWEYLIKKLTRKDKEKILTEGLDFLKPRFDRYFKK